MGANRRILRLARPLPGRRRHARGIGPGRNFRVAAMNLRDAISSIDSDRMNTVKDPLVAQGYKLTDVPGMTDLAVVERGYAHKDARLDRHIELAMRIEVTRDLERPMTGGRCWRLRLARLLSHPVVASVRRLYRRIAVTRRGICLAASRRQWRCGCDFGARA